MPSILNATTSSGLVTSADNSGSLQLATNNGTTAVTIDTSQNVGIGTASPTARLDVRRSTTDGLIAEFHQSSGYGIDIASSDTVASISSGYLQAFTFKTDSGSGQVERMRIDSSGRVTMPSQPTFTVRKSNGTTSTAAGIIVFNAVSVNVGSHYNNANGRFTAPIAGRYLFIFTGASQATSDFGFLINGTGTNYSGYATGSNTTSTATAIFNLNANDYVQVEALATYRGENHNMWCGCLIN
jgi:hypothetical protein